MPRLVRAAGLRGWLLLIDEVELIGRYSRLQRDRAYAELARWIGGRTGESRPGLLTIGAITDDFEGNVLRGARTADLDDMAVYLAGRDEATAAAAQSGMRIIRESALLEQPTDPVLQRTYSALRSLHSEAYGWEPPDVAWPEALGSTAMRTFVRAWINAWDVRRLYPGFVEGDSPYEIHRPASDYREDPDLTADDGAERPSDADAPAADGW